MTEEEAKTKWCHATAFRSMADALDREPENASHRLNGSRCLASACMAWRGHTRLETRHRDGHVVQPGEVYLRGNATTQKMPDGGFCGLAGAPL